MNQEQAESLLAQTHLFRGLDQSVIATLAAEGHERTDKRHAQIFHEGDPGDAFFIVEDAVKVYVTSARGEEMVLTTMRSPETLGEVSLFGPRPRQNAAPRRHQRSRRPPPARRDVATVANPTPP